MIAKKRSVCAAAVAALWIVVPGYAQFAEPITGFETDRDGGTLEAQPASFDDLRVVMFQDPAEADVTAANVVPDITPAEGELPSTEESFVAEFTGDGFFGADGSTQFLDIRFQWADPSDTTRWVLVETLQSPIWGDPAVHLEGVVSMKINLPDCSAFEFPDLTRPARIGVAILIRETGNAVPQGFQDTSAGNLEFVGVTEVLNADTDSPLPVPLTYIDVTDANCSGNQEGDWIDLSFDLDALGDAGRIIGWTAEGGDGTLDATGLGDGQNRGVLAGLVLVVEDTDTTSDYLEFLVDSIEFDAPFGDPTIAPRLGTPIIQGDVLVRVNDVLSSATDVQLEIDRATVPAPTDCNTDGNVDLVDFEEFQACMFGPTGVVAGGCGCFDYDASGHVDQMDFAILQIGFSNPFTADEVYNRAPGGDLFIDMPAVPLAEPLAIGDRVRARQTNPAGTSDGSILIQVNPPAAFSLTLALDEDGNCGVAPADFEWVGATSIIGTAGTQGKPVFVKNGVWQKVEFSLIPGVEPVIDFAGGNGLLQPDGGDYNIDSLFFTIDSTAPSVGPYDVFLDHVFVTTAENEEVIIADAESFNPFPNFRGQSTSVGNSSTLSTLTSFDGGQANRIQWEFPDTATLNTCAPFRPCVPFDDTVKAVGVWLLVEDVRTNGLPLPEILGPVVGDVPFVTVMNIDDAATGVDLLVNGEVAGHVDLGRVTQVDIMPEVTLNIGDSISAVYTTDTDTSDLAYPRGVTIPPAPAVQGPLVEGMTNVTVTGLLDLGSASASAVTLYDGESVLTSVDPAGASSVIIEVSPALAVGQQISASQTVNELESVRSAPVGVGTGEIVCVVINEVVYDDTGADDDREYVELYNADPEPVDISGWTVRASDTAAPPGDDNPDYVIPGSTVLQPGDFYVLGDSGVPNVDLVFPGVAGEGDLENANEALELLDENGVVVDTFIYELNKGPVAVSPAEGGQFGNSQSYDDHASSWSRWFDGYDTDNNGRDFGYLPITPGTTNNVAALAKPFTETFNGGTVDTQVTNWLWSFQGLRYIDPTDDSSLANPAAIPPSPQGGLAATMWDQTGGGDMAYLTDEARFNIAFSCELYIDATTSPFTEGNTFDESEQWSIGLGTTGSLYNQNRPVLTPEGANGDTGLVWKFNKVEDADTGLILDVRLQLIDENDGGADGLVLFDVPAVALTDGWHTLSITRNYDSYSAAFDAEATSGTLAGNGPSTLFIGYREFVAGTPTTLRPPTIDNLQLTIPAAPTLGACCFDCDCLELTDAECTAIAGAYSGDDTTCEDLDTNGIADVCEAFVPPAPTIEGTLCDGGMVVTVSGIVPESGEVTVYEGGVNPIGTMSTGGATSVAVFAVPALATGDMITATQTAGGEESDPSAGVTVITCGAPTTTVVINEFSYDDSGTDDEQYVELYNTGLDPVDIGGWALRHSDTVAPPGDNNADFGIPDGTTLAAGDYYVLGAATVAEVDQVVGTTAIWENANEAIELIDYTGGIVDTVIYELNKGPVAVTGEGGIWANYSSYPPHYLTWNRYLDGYDTDNNGRDFGLRPRTPGADNLGTGSEVSDFVLADVDGLSVGDPHPGLSTGAFVSAQVIDPTVGAEGTPNPNAIVASPQGGLCSVAWDPAGGGNTVVSDDVVTGSGYDMYVYLDTTPYGVGGAESVTYGIAGTTGPLYNFPDPSGLLFASEFETANGNTGIGWLFEKEDSASLISLKLIDFGDGGDSSPVGTVDWIVITDIDMTSEPSGWYRLSIDYNDTTGDVVAKVDDDTFNFTTDTDLIGIFYIGYRESLQGDRFKIRPPTFDALP